MLIKCIKCGEMNFINLFDMEDRRLYQVGCCGAFIYRWQDKLMEPNKVVFDKLFGNDSAKFAEFLEDVEKKFVEMGMWG